MRAQLRVALLLGASLAVVRESRADDCEPRQGLSTCVDVDNLWARPGSSAFLSLGPTESTPAGEVAFGALVSYQRRPIRLEIPGPSLEPRQVYVVDNALGMTFLLSLGVAEGLEVTLASAATLYQDGAGLAAIDGSDQALTRSVMRDPRLGVAYTFVRRERTADAEGLALTGRFEVAAPLGDGEAFAGARGGTFVPALTGSYRVGPFEAAAEVSSRIRRKEALGDATWGSQLGAALGANVVVWEPAGLSVGAEAFALPVLEAQAGDAPVLTPAEWIASVRSAPFLSGDIFFHVAGGSSIPLTASAATSPELRFSFAAGYAPRALDSDRDGVLDRDDNCVRVPEDRDGFQDQDGCPDLDNDADGVPDPKDRCRDAAETVDGFQDDDGCPDDDDDGDGVPDEEDECRNEKEDKDGFNDADGCPDPDNDGDGTLDAKDECPLGKEDKDGFRDADGCPDPDNDADGVLDVDDKCPVDREDVDKFADADGCPDLDNDDDGVLDGDDLCPNDAETLDGKDDDDGCPEPGAKKLVSLAKDRVVFVDAGSFVPRKAELNAALANQVRAAARLLKPRAAQAQIVVEAYADGNDALALKRAQEVKRILVEQGIPAQRISAAAGDHSQKRTQGAAPVDITLLASAEPKNPGEQ